MRIKRISIKKYKNLRNLECEFSESNLSAFIGNNGSGKSNLLEVVADVFSYAKNSIEKKHPGIIVSPDVEDCIIEYEKDGIDYTFKCDNSDVSVFRADKKLSEAASLDALPSNVLVYYAGETDRQRKNALDTYDNIYFNKLKNAKNNEFPGFKFMDYCSIEDLSLLLLVAVIYKGVYYEELLQLLRCDEVLPKVTIYLKDPKGKTENADTFWNARGFVESFLNDLRKRVKTTQDLGRIYVMNFDDIRQLKEFASDEGDMFAKFKALKNAGYINFISVKLKGKTGEIFDWEHLSEGEKQLSLLLLLTSFTSQYDCLYLFDEFDAYLHLNWQKSFSKMIGNIDIQGHLIFTTHSPATISGMKKKNVYILSDGNIILTPSETFNRSLDEIMEEHMLVSMRPHEYNLLVQEFRNAVIHNKKEVAEAKLEQLREIIGDEDPFFITARIALNRMEIE